MCSSCAQEQEPVPDRREGVVDIVSYAVIRLEGQFAASISLLVGAPRISEEFIEVNGFWLPGRVRSVASSFLLGTTELDIRFSDYRLGWDLESLR
jgi:hypothetical protein